MPLVLKDRVRETTTTVGTGAYTLAGAVTGFQAFSVVGNGNTTYYAATDGTSWEVGIGTYTASGTTLSRDTILESSNGGSAVSWAAGTKQIFVTYPAERSLYVEGSSIVPATAATLPVTSGGTNANTEAGARTNLGATTVGSNLFTLVNPSAVRFLRVNADNTVSPLSDTDFRTAIGAGTGNGTVTSVGLSFTGGIVSVANSPVTGSATLALTIAGTSGGIPYFSSASAWASSGLLAANALMVGGGAGAAPSTITTGTGIVTFLGTPSSANLAAAVTDETGSGALVFATSPTLVTPILGTPTSGNLSNCTADGTNAVGYKDIPQNSQSADYPLVLSDAGKQILHPSADTTPRTFTIPANGSVAFPVGTAVTFINQNGAGVVTIGITTDTMRLAGAGTTGSRTLAANGIATAVKVTSTEWIISGVGLT